MIEVIFLSVLALLWIAFASVHDLKTKTIPNWISFSLVIFALGFRFFYSLFNENLGFFYQGLIGLGIFFLVGNALYYGRMFSAGDAKLMIALGAVLPFSINFMTNFKIFSVFLFLFLISGAVYGLGWSIFLPLKNPKLFKKNFLQEFKSHRKVIYSTITLSIIILLGGFFEILFVYLGLLVFAFSYLYVFAKTIDTHLLVKEVSTKKLEEGDWIQKNIKVENKIINARWHGLNAKEIRLIQKKYKTIKIKEGVPFVPVFFISFLALVYVYFWNFSIIERLFGFFG